MNFKQLKLGQSLAFGVTYKEYKELHPRTKKTEDDPMFTKEKEAKSPEEKPVEQKPTDTKEAPKEESKTNDLIGKKFLHSQMMQDNKGRTHFLKDTIIITDVKDGKIQYKMADGTGGGFAKEDGFLEDIKSETAKEIKPEPEKPVEKVEEKPEPKEEKREPTPKEKEDTKELQQEVKKSEDVVTQIAEKEQSESPRQKAKENDKEMGKDYIYARASSFSNIGEDLKGSARHKRNEWKGLDAAEKDGTAHDMVKRDTLLKSDPLDFVVHAEKNPVNALALNLVLKKFPVAPTVPKHLKDTKDDEFVYKMKDKAVFYNDRYMNYYRYKAEDAESKMTMADYKKEARKQYVAAFNTIKGEVNKHLINSSDKDLKEILGELEKSIDPQIKEIRKIDQYSDVANDLAKFRSNTVRYSEYPSKNSVMGDLSKFTKLAHKNLGGDPEKAKDAIMSILEGKSIEKALGEESAKKRGFDPASLYVKPATRKGPKLDFNDKESQEKFLAEESKLRGLQYGNSVTDEERKHHLQKVAESFYDLTDVLELPKEMGSFNGKLGMAIGARGIKDALAHYEPDNVNINLTRKGGVGSLAHEWWHFFDNTMAKSATGGKAQYMSNSSKAVNEIGRNELQSAFLELQQSVNDVKKRMAYDDDARAVMALSGRTSSYWLSSEEISARCFENYLADKLDSKDRENTYLTQLKSGGHALWASKEEMTKMTPIFDKIFKEFKGSKYVKAFFDNDLLKLKELKLGQSFSG